MMNPRTDDLLEHTRWLRIAAAATGAELIIAGDHLHALLRRGSEHRLLLPRFRTPDGKPRTTPTFFAECDGFAGWLSHPGRLWPIGANRLAFKELVRSVGLGTPDAFTDAAANPENIVVKPSSTEAIAPIRGPFRSGSDQPLRDGEYYERYVDGDRLRIWFWNESPICAEQERSPCVIGDGRSPLGDLILHRASYTGPRSEREGAALLEEATVFLRFHGRTLETVLARGERQIVDLRHGSALRHPSDRRTHDLRAATELRWTAAARALGTAAYLAIPEPIRKDTLFTVDAILDTNEQPWFLEMDCSPTVHPFAYPAILASLFEPLPVNPAAAAPADGSSETSTRSTS